MKKLPPIELMEDIAIELGVDHAFIEKDWFAVQTLMIISSISELDIVFTGGTSLSKGFGLIKRFSEDLDFRIINSSKLTRKERKSIRTNIFSKLRNIDYLSIVDTSIKSRNESKFFSFNIEYPFRSSRSMALRPYLKLEFSFEEVQQRTELKPIQSFVTELTKKQEIDCKVNTISPVETAADKFCALLWRIDIKDRTFDIGTPQNDPTIMRHLHDLSALETLVVEDNHLFVSLVHSLFEKDKNRGGKRREESVKELADKTSIKLKEDILYKQEYTKFVEAMSYAFENEIISFQHGINSFKIITDLFL